MTSCLIFGFLIMVMWAFGILETYPIRRYAVAFAAVVAVVLPVVSAHYTLG